MDNIIRNNKDYYFVIKLKLFLFINLICTTIPYTNNIKNQLKNIRLDKLKFLFNFKLSSLASI